MNNDSKSQTHYYSEEATEKGYSNVQDNSPNNQPQYQQQNQGQNYQGYDQYNQYPNQQFSQNSGQIDDVVLIIIALFIPPLAVYLKFGCGNQVWLNILLCLISFGIFGIIHAIIIIAKK